MSHCKGCSFCIRHGLPILPVHPALMEKTEALPPLPASIKMPIPTQGDTAYTARLLREGYLYIYDEMVKGWLDYFVTEEGHYYPLPTKGPIAPNLAAGKTKPCAEQPAALAKASLITLPVMPAGKKNGLFWLSWSQVPWTPATRKAHEDASYRAQYMQRFDMDAWINSQQAENVLPLSTLENCVAEYSAQASQATVKEWSQAPWKSTKRLDALPIIGEAQLMYAGHGAIMVLQDPVALAQDLAWLANYRINKNFYENPAYMRELVLTSAVHELKASICEQYKSEMVLRDQAEELNIAIGYEPTSGMRIPASPAMSDKLRQYNLKALDGRIERRWQEQYGKFYDEEKEKAFNASFKRTLEHYDQQVIVPMMKVYLAWLRSDALVHYFQHNFDPEDVDSGMLYTQTVTDCVDGVQDKLLVLQYFREQLVGSCTDKNNFLARAAVFNHDPFAEEINSSVHTSVDVNTLPWDKPLDGFTLIFTQKIAAAQLVLLKYQNAVSGTLYTLIDKVIDSKPAHALVSFAVVSNQRIKVIEVVGARKDFVGAVVRETAETFGIVEQRGIDQLRHFVDLRMRDLEAQGVKLTGTQVNRFGILVDARDAAHIPSAPGAAQAKAIAQTLRSMDEVKATIFPNNFRSQLAALKGSSPQAISTSALKSLPFAGCVLSAAFQGYILYHAGLPKEFAVDETTTRFAANIAIALGTSADAVERLLTNFKSIRLNARIRLTMGLTGQKFIMVPIQIVKWLGGAAGIIMAVFDFYHAIDEVNQGHGYIGIAYLCSAVGGGALGFVVILNLTLAPVWIIIFVALFFGAQLYLALNIKNDIQIWLMSCLWRKIPVGEKEIPAIYPTSKMEMDALQLAITSGAV